MQINYSRLGNLIKESREAQGLSMRDLAAITGVSASTLCRAENGYTLEPDHLFAVMDWLGVDLDEIRKAPSKRSVVNTVGLMLHSDPSLNDEGAAVISRTVRAMHKVLAQ